jgi:hypothetical protein
MTEVFAEALSLVNLPFTVFLGLVIVYWILVAVGAIGDQFGSDMGSDLDAGHDLDASTDGDLPSDGHVAGHGDGWFTGVLHFINLGEVPIMAMLSILTLCLWTCSMITNHYFTEHQASLALAFVIPNLIVSALATRYLTLPLQPLFRMVRRAEGEEVPLVGRSCRITTSTANSTFGQAEIETKGAPLLIDVRTMDGVALPRGADAVIFRHDAERGIYYVVEVSNPQLS